MLEIRAARPGDAEAIRNVHLRAFPTSMEADLVEQIERDGDMAISLVAVDRQQVIGHILFSRISAEAEGRKLNALGLAPVAVLTDRQGQGVGSHLVELGLEQARSLGADIVFLVGEPDFYGRFGFSVEVARPFASPYAGAYFQALALSDEPLDAIYGTAEYAPAFAALS